MQPEPATHVSVDVVALRFAARELTFASHRRPLDPFAGDLALPGVLLLAGETIADAARRALRKIAAEPLATGQLRTFDEPNRDPRGPTLSLATWAVLAPDADDDATWADLADHPALAFDHDHILERVRPVLAGMLWRDLTFTRALTGETFTAGDAVALTLALVGKVDRGNLNRELARIETLRAGETTITGAGRPGRVWHWVGTGPAPDSGS